MSLIPAEYPGLASELVEGVSFQSVTFSYGAFVSAGTRCTLIPSMATATTRQFLMLGSGSANITLPVATALVTDPNGQPNSNPLESQRANLALGMSTYFTGIPAASDGAYCYGFAIGGMNCTDVVEIILSVQKRSSVATNYSIVLKNINISTQIGGFPFAQPGNQSVINLNNSNQILLQDGVTALTYGTNTIVVCPAYGVIFGAIQTPDVSDVPAAGDYLELTVRYR